MQIHPTFGDYQLQKPENTFLAAAPTFLLSQATLVSRANYAILKYFLGEQKWNPQL